MNATIDQPTAFLARRRCLSIAARPVVKLYHSDIFIPESEKLAAEKLVFSHLEWTMHAKMELIEDPYGVLPAHTVPKCFFGVAWHLVELETQNGVATKYVFRRNVVGDRDLIIVLRPLDKSMARVVTCWTNLKTDTHSTLDRAKYDNN